MSAGSAIGQKAGRISKIDSWFPSDRPRKWLLISGSTQPPESITVSGRRKDNSGEYLPATKDLNEMEQAVGPELYNAVRDLKITRSFALSKIKEFASECHAKKHQPILYYSGHGEVGTGDWLFVDGKIGLKDIIEIFDSNSYFSIEVKYPLILSDACYSGCWANECYRMNERGMKMHCLSACREFQVAYDIPEGGGELTKYMTSTDSDSRPRAEPLYSAGSEADFPPNQKYSKVNFSEVLEFKLEREEQLESLCILDDQLFAVFRKADKCNVSAFECDSFDLLKSTAIEIWKSKEIITALSVHPKNGKFYGQFCEKAGVSQSLISDNEFSFSEAVTSPNSPLVQKVELEGALISPYSRIEACFYHSSRIWLLITHYQDLQRPQMLYLYDNFDKGWWMKFNDPKDSIFCSCVIKTEDEPVKFLLIVEENVDTSNSSLSVHDMWCQYIYHCYLLHGGSRPGSPSIKIAPNQKDGVEGFSLYPP